MYLRSWVFKDKNTGYVIVQNVPVLDPGILGPSKQVIEIIDPGSKQLVPIFN